MGQLTSKVFHPAGVMGGSDDSRKIPIMTLLVWQFVVVSPRALTLLDILNVGSAVPQTGILDRVKRAGWGGNKLSSSIQLSLLYN